MTVSINGTTGITTPTYGGSVSAEYIIPVTRFKNRIINGGFGVNQRAVSGSVVLSAGAFGHDRWKGGASGCSYTFATSENVTTLTISAGSLIQVVEGINLQSGTHTLSWTGTATAKIGGGSLSATGVTGTATGGTNLNIEISTGTVSLIQLEVGDTATSFDYRPYGTELALCQRYYQVGYQRTRVDPFPAGALGASSYFSVDMRAQPTMTGAAVLGVLTSSSATGVGSAFFNFTSGASGNIANTFTASAEL